VSRALGTRFQGSENGTPYPELPTRYPRRTYPSAVKPWPSTSLPRFLRSSRTTTEPGE
jgi:hypothetical protein